MTVTRQIRIGYSLTYELEQATPMIALVNVHYSRASDLRVADTMATVPSVPYTSYRDVFGNWCNRLVAPAGTFRLHASGVVDDAGTLDVVAAHAGQTPVEDLPSDALVYLLPSRYCESDRMIETAWHLFGSTAPGWERVQAISRWVHEFVTFGYEWARPTKSAWEVLQEGRGVCRDFAHLGIALCRALNVPARYCTGYLPDLDVPLSPEPMDFAGWFEVLLDGHWYVVDPRNLVPRSGRVLVARGRDAADVAITTTFGPNVLRDFRVDAAEVVPAVP